MPSPTQITVPQLSRLIGLPGAPRIIDVRAPSEFNDDPRLIPTARRHDCRELQSWANRYAGESVVVTCHHGSAPSEGVGAWLRGNGVNAQTLEGGYDAWTKDSQSLVRADKLPACDAAGRSVWITRARPKIVRIACPWLIRRFIDPDAVFLFVPPSVAQDVADQLQATPFDLSNAFWNDRGDRCTFDVMIEELGLATAALSRLATIVRGADTGRLDLAPQSAGLLAASLGYSRMFRDDLAQLDAAMGLYDAFYRWCRDATDETHS